MSAGRRSTAIDIALALFAGVLACAVYIRSLAPGLLWGDSAEFQFAAWLGGFVHPTGYPLYLMLGWLWTHLLPFRDPAFRMNLFSALWGGLAITLLCLVVIRLFRFIEANDIRNPRWISRLIAFGTALVFLFTPTFWSQAVIAEVYTLHAAFVAGLLLVLFVWAERVANGEAAGARRLAYLAALLFGLSLAHHRSTILLAPAAALFVLIVLAGTRSRPRASFQKVGLFLFCLLAPSLLYLYIPLRAPQVPYVSLTLSPGQPLTLYDPTPAGFFAHISGSIFGSSLVAPRLDSPGLARVVDRFVDELSINGLLLGAIGLAALVFVSVRSRSWRGWAALTLTGAFFLVQVAFNLFYAIGDIYVFYIPAYLAWVLWMAVGAWAVTQVVAWLFSSLEEQSRRWLFAAAAVLAFVVLATFAFRSAFVFWPKVQRATDDSARRAWDALLSSDLPKGAILVSNDRDEITPLWYLTYVEGRRNDLTGLFPLIKPGEEWENVVRVTDAALQTGRPVYLVKPMPGLEIKYDLAQLPGQGVGPLGPAVRVDPLPPVGPAHRLDIVYGDTVVLVGYEVVPEPLVAGEPAQITLYWDPLREMKEDWTTFVQVIDKTGNKAGQSDHRPGGVYYPSSLWSVGERLRDTHTLNVAPGATRGTNQLIVGLYVQDGEDLRRLGSPSPAGEVKVSR